MSQNDYIIANQTAPNFRSDLNDALQALASLSSGATAPSTTYANMLWYDTANNFLKMRTEADDAWITIGTLNQSTNEFEVANLTELTQVQAEDDTDTTFGLVSGQRLGQAVAANSIISKEYTSSGNTLTRGSSLTLAHGLGVEPKLIQAWIEFTTASDGFSVGDKIYVNPALQVAGPDNRGFSVEFDATNLVIHYGNEGLDIIVEGGGGRGTPPESRWQYYVRAWA